jgi:hypothetical protein
MKMVIVEEIYMTFLNGGVRRVLAGKEFGVVLGVLLAGSLLVQASFLPAYLAVLFASGVRNVYVASLGNGILFWIVAFVGLYVQAVAITASYLAVRTISGSLRNPPPDEPSA